MSSTQLLQRLYTALPAVARTFAHLMLVNYLTHGINIAQDASYAAPADAINAILGGALAPGTLRAVHGTTHIAARAYGAAQLALSLLNQFPGGVGTPSRPAAPPPTI